MSIGGSPLKARLDPVTDTSTPLQAIHQLMAEGVPTGKADDAHARRLWWGALEVLQQRLLSADPSWEGVWIAAPLPALYAPELLQRYWGWVWAPEALTLLNDLQSSTLLPSDLISAPTGVAEAPLLSHRFQRMTLCAEDSQDPFLLVITSKLQIALALQGQEGERRLLMRSEPSLLTRILALVEQRLREEDQAQAKSLHQALNDLGPLQSSGDFALQFWPDLAQRLASMAPTVTFQTAHESPEATPQAHASGDIDAELSLLEAIAHEVRTPLATIRTLIRSLLRRRDLPMKAMERLQQIDTECSEQIDRFGLIFQAAELQRQPEGPSPLARTDLGAMVRLLSPIWTQQLKRRGVGFAMTIADSMPLVLSDPGRLEPMLGGLVDRCSRSLPPGSKLLLTLQPAGARLKLQLISHTPEQIASQTVEPVQQERLGPVLSWNTNTGSLQLSQTATRRLLESLGGRVTQRRDRGLTVFFPIAEQC